MHPVLVLQHEPSVPPGSIDTVLQEEQVDHLVFKAWLDEDWPSVDDIGALVVLGGTMNVDQVDDYPFIGRGLSLLSDAMKAEVPTLGICLGSQMIAKILGQPVYRSDPRNALFSPLRPTSEGLKDPLLKTFSKDVAVLQFHEDTYEIPQGAVALATSAATGRPQAFRYGDCTYAIQFHFEVDDAILRGWIDNIGSKKLQKDWETSAEDLLREAAGYLSQQRQAGKELFRRFLKKAEQV